MFKYALKLTISLLFVGVIQYYFSFSHENWMLLSAFLVVQTSYEIPIQRGLYFVSALAVMVALLSALQSSFNFKISVFVFYCFLLVLPWILIFYTEQWRAMLRRHVYVLVVLLIGFLTALPINQMEMRICDILIGGIIGLACVIFLFPPSSYANLTQALLPAIEKIENAFEKIINALVQQQNTELQNLREITSMAIFPEWVYQRGFNPGLRAGYRYFLIEFERLQQLTYLIAKQELAPLPVEITKALALALRNNIKILHILKQHFQGIPYTNLEQNDWLADIQDLEGLAQTIMPNSLESLSLDIEMVKLSLIIRYAKELRETLFTLLMTLK